MRWYVKITTSKGKITLGSYSTKKEAERVAGIMREGQETKSAEVTKGKK